jgi:hypothetical protein
MVFPFKNMELTRRKYAEPVNQVAAMTFATHLQWRWVIACPANQYGLPGRNSD